MFSPEIFMSSLFLYTVNITVFDHDKMIGIECKDTLIHGMDMMVLMTTVNFSNVDKDVAQALSFVLTYYGSNEITTLCELEVDRVQCGKHKNEGCFCHTENIDGTMDILLIVPAITTYSNASIFAQTTSRQHNKLYKSKALVIPPIYKLTGFLRINNKTYSDNITKHVIRLPADIEYCCSEPIMNCEAAVYFGTNILDQGKSCARFKYPSKDVSLLSFSLSACGHTNKTPDVLFIPQSDISENVPTSATDISKKPETDNIYKVVLIIFVVLLLVTIVAGGLAIFTLWKKLSSLEIKIQKSNNVKQECQCKQLKSSLTDTTAVGVDLDDGISCKAQGRDKSNLIKKFQQFQKHETQAFLHQDNSSLKLKPKESNDENNLLSSGMDEIRVLTRRDNN
ncbi:hypothetical protein Btru_023013 [Bulinus truncatus]|nr:hypothetical protein Btru_023013 [Bulinus truncatus]